MYVANVNARRFSPRQRETNLRACARGRVCPDASAVGFDDGAGEGESQASAFGLLDGVGGAIEAVEDVRQVFGLDARALVADAHDHLLGAHLSADADLALRRVLERVRDEIGKHLFDARLVRQDDGEFFGEVGNELMLG